jgi:nucleoside-diphosphate-sugar epimerase
MPIGRPDAGRMVEATLGIGAKAVKQGGTTEKRLATKIIELTGSRSQIVHRPLPEDDPRQRRPDISRANEALNRAPPHTTLPAGLTRTIAYF